MDDQRDYEEENSNRAEMIREGMAEVAAELEELQRATPRELPSVTQWACQCCTFVMANGECCDSDQHGGDGIEPLSEIPNGANTTLGMSYEEHEKGCPNRLRTPAGESHDCDCETRSFSWSSCDACGSNLGGTRHAFIIWSPAMSLTEATNG